MRRRKAQWRKQNKLKKILHKVCPVCGAEFETTYTHKKYCSEECAAKAQQETREQWRYRTGSKKIYHRTCPECGAEIETSHNLKKYCSDQCRDEATKKLQDAYNKKKLEERRKKSQAQKATKIKPQTKKIKPQSASKIKPVKEKPVKVTQEPVIIPINPETGKYIVTCVGCGKTFETPDKSQRYCSFRCRMSSIDKRQKDKEKASAERAIKAMERARNQRWFCG